MARRSNRSTGRRDPQRTTALSPAPRATSRFSSRTSVTRAPRGRNVGTNLLRYALPAAVVAGLVYLLWPKKALADTTPNLPPDNNKPPPDNNKPGTVKDEPVAVPTPGTAGHDVRVTSLPATLRGAPSTRARVIRNLEINDRLISLQTNDTRAADGFNWVRVSWPDLSVTGWVANERLGVLPDVQPNVILDPVTGEWIPSGQGLVGPAFGPMVPRGIPNTGAYFAARPGLRPYYAPRRF